MWISKIGKERGEEEIDKRERMKMDKKIWKEGRKIGIEGGEGEVEG